MKFGMTPSPFQRSARSTHHIMWELTAALVVVWIAAIVKNFVLYSDLGIGYGLQAIFIPITAVLTAFVMEAIVSLYTVKDLKKKPAVLDFKFYIQHAWKFFNDSFGYVSALIFSLTLPVGTPLWIVVIGVLVVIFIGRVVFGGLGYNIPNPAALGRIFVTVSFPAALVVFLAGDAGSFGATITGIFTKSGLTAENLAYLFSRDSAMFGMNMFDLWLGNYAGALGETFTFLLLGLMIILAVRKVLDWRLSVSYLVTIAVAAAVFALWNGLPVHTYILGHLGAGGVMFAATFMVTDPVTTPTSRFGKIIWGMIAGTLTFVIRTQTDYPEGVAFSIILSNFLTPAIDSLISGKTIAKLPQKWAIIGGGLIGSLALTVLPLNGRVAAVVAFQDDPFVSITFVRTGLYHVVTTTHNDAEEHFYVYVDYLDQTIYRIDSFDAVTTPAETDEVVDFFTNPAATSNTAIMDYYNTYFVNDFSVSFADAKTYSLKKTDFDTAGATYTTTATRSALKQVALLAEQHPLASAEVAATANANEYSVTVGAGTFGDVKLIVTVDPLNELVTSVVNNASTIEPHVGDGIPDFFDGVTMPTWIGASLNLSYADALTPSYKTVGPESGVDAEVVGATWSSKAIVIAIQAVVLTAQGE